MPLMPGDLVRPLGRPARARPPGRAQHAGPARRAREMGDRLSHVHAAVGGVLDFP
jgi:hypothetical protein